MSTSRQEVLLQENPILKCITDVDTTAPRSSTAPVVFSWSVVAPVLNYLEVLLGLQPIVVLSMIDVDKARRCIHPPFYLARPKTPVSISLHRQTSS